MQIDRGYERPPPLMGIWTLIRKMTWFRFHENVFML